MDPDLVITHDKAQFLKLESAMDAIGLLPRLPIRADELYEFREEYIRNRNPRHRN